MNFASDNATGFAPEMLEALTRANQGSDMPYGEDAVTARLKQRIADIWGKIKDDPPKTLTLERQSLFAMGYYQQTATRKTKKDDLNDNAKETATE